MISDSPGRSAHSESMSVLSELFTEGLPVDGVSVSVVGHTGDHSVISSSGGTATDLELLQFGLGEGPHWETLQEERPVLISDIRSVDAARWPIFAHQVRGIDVRGLFSLPLTVGVAVVGVVDLHRRMPGPLTSEQLTTALRLTRSVSRAAVYAATNAANQEHPFTTEAAPEMRREVHQATGILVSQLNSTPTSAFASLRAYSYAHDRTVDDVAADIVRHRLDLSDNG